MIADSKLLEDAAERIARGLRSFLGDAMAEGHDVALGELAPELLPRRTLIDEVSGPSQAASTGIDSRSSSVPTNAGASRQFRYCTNCGAALPLAANFCGACGTAVDR
jgi:hypothetical protein